MALPPHNSINKIAILTFMGLETSFENLEGV